VSVISITLRCPYCVLENEFRPMAAVAAGRFVCGKCGHLPSLATRASRALARSVLSSGCPPPDVLDRWLAPLGAVRTAIN
jgi:hypothetical protein